MPVAEHGGRRALRDASRRSHLLELAPSRTCASAGVELRFHQVRHQMDDVGFETPVQEAARGLETQQPAADDRGPARRVAGEAHDALAIVERAKDEDALFEAPVFVAHVRERRNHGAAAGRDDQRVVSLRQLRPPRVTRFALQVDRLDAAGPHGASRPLAAYQDIGLMKMSSGLWLRDSTLESRIRL